MPNWLICLYARTAALAWGVVIYNRIFQQDRPADLSSRNLSIWTLRRDRML